jgi:hypothetical protein
VAVHSLSKHFQSFFGRLNAFLLAFFRFHSASVFNLDIQISWIGRYRRTPGEVAAST